MAAYKSRICPECGKEFIPKNGYQKYYEGPHIAICPICNKEYSYIQSPREKPKACSKECTLLLREKTKQNNLLAKYGVTNVSKLKEVRDKISEKNKSDEVRLKREATCLERYGATNPSKSSAIKLKLSEIMSSEEFLNKREITCLKKYGSKSPMSNKEIIAKRNQTYIDKYGQLRPPRDRSYYYNMITDGSKVDEYLAFKSDPKKYIEEHYEGRPTYQQLQHDLGVTDAPILMILKKNKCKDLISLSKSHVEEEVFTFLKSILSDVEVRHNDRTQIAPYELDFYIPDFNIAIECNPASTHNSSIGWLRDIPIDYKYHQMKSKLCEERGIFLFHIFGYEWNLKQEIIKSMLRNIFNKNEFKHGARETYIEEISYNECKEFLNQNHRQGNTSSKIRLGLKLKSDNFLMSVMTFGRLRNTMGKSHNVTENSWELSRFCTRLNTNISGGASKLFKYFIKNYNPSEVISFSDVAHTKGILYEKLGFSKEYQTPPNYFYTDLYDTKFLNRVNCQKQYLSKLFNEDIDMSKTEKQIMEEHRFVRTYDSGVIKWVWNQFS